MAKGQSGSRMTSWVLNNTIMRLKTADLIAKAKYAMVLFEI